MSKLDAVTFRCAALDRAATPKSSAERVRAYRARLRSHGLIPSQYYVHPDDAADVQRYIDRKNKQRGL